VAAGGVHEQGQRVGRAADLARVLRRDGLSLPLLDLDVAGLQVRAQLSDLVGVQIVLERDRLELFLGDQPALLSFVEKDADRGIDVRQVQLASLLLFCRLDAISRHCNAAPVRTRTDLNEKDLPGIPGDPNVRLVQNATRSGRGLARSDRTPYVAVKVR
jgi:hypothetical protein